MSFCFHCGSKLSERIPTNDDRLRLVCTSCNYIHYDNPRVLVNVQLHCGSHLFWIKRAREPRKGFWSFPAGFLESGESLQAGAARELKEETGIDVEPSRLIPYGIVSVVTMNQVYVVFRYPCEFEIEGLKTSEVEDWGWFAEKDAPWDNLAFPEAAKQIHKTYSFLNTGEFPIHVSEVLIGGRHSWHYGMNSDLPVKG